MASGISARVVGPAGARQPGDDQLERVQHRHRGDRRWACERIRAGLAERMLCGGVRGREPLHLGRLRRHARALPRLQRRAGAGLAADERLAPAASSRRAARACCCSRASRARARAARASTPRCSARAVNCGGHRGGGSMTAPNPEGVRRCIRAALATRASSPARSTRSTAISPRPAPTRARWRRGPTALERRPRALPPITSTKSMIGHALGAAGAIECVASRADAAAAASCTLRSTARTCIPEIAPYAASIPHAARDRAGSARRSIKAGFGFGDVNACVVFRKWSRQLEATTRRRTTMSEARCSTRW